MMGDNIYCRIIVHSAMAAGYYNTSFPALIQELIIPLQHFRSQRNEFHDILIRRNRRKISPGDIFPRLSSFELLVDKGAFHMTARNPRALGSARHRLTHTVKCPVNCWEIIGHCRWIK